MSNATLRPDTAMVHISWPDGSNADFPYIWLRDNDPAAFHPQTKERTGDLTSFSLDVCPAKIEADDNSLTIWWADETTVSSFDMGWLRQHRPGKRAADPAHTGFGLWRQDLGAEGVPRVQADQVLNSDSALQDWLVKTQVSGFSIVEGLADNTDAGMDVARRIGFLRQTNFGLTFEVQSKPNPNNLAYTSIALPLHTDLTNQELPPGFQFLHCLANEAQGGGSLFCDGYAIAEDLRQLDPEAFELLSTVSIPFRFHDEDTDIRSRKKVINLDEDGQVIEICFNAHIADVLDLEPALMTRYYRAYRQYMIMTRADAYLVTLKLKAGEMVVFDNRRVLHGREAFDPQTGFRHLHGCYVDRGEFESRLRVLNR
ncbi:TauD/TfdA family dioxygenase [Parasedimentitalea psychrophila]|uniref:trimethyllysine dioxygenase n=1 Tax=Parasedimentitalea psychrophila TaxID=2997337 RepID=A0A9Y2P8E5_9RHOB|nr:TauD/TfdA family dioxygenase [Parasedimentitalea psychrophila]WIY26988.1 TauD/TfdA family dioxygenase [Parasedimentitalea psychrophila]